MEIVVDVGRDGVLPLTDLGSVRCRRCRSWGGSGLLLAGVWSVEFLEELPGTGGLPVHQLGEGRGRRVTDCHVHWPRGQHDDLLLSPPALD